MLPERKVCAEAAMPIMLAAIIADTILSRPLGLKRSTSPPRSRACSEPYHTKCSISIDQPQAVEKQASRRTKWV
jgi:hypothetical protein